MGIAGRGPKIKIQAPEERAKSDPRPTTSTLVASTSSVVSNVWPVGVGSLGARNYGLPEVFTEGEPKETTGVKRWLRMIVPFARAMGL